MNKGEIDFELREAAARARDLSRRVVLDPHHKLRLREELLRRHQELSAVTTQRAAGTLWSRLTGPRRLTLVAPPALAVFLTVVLVFAGIPFSKGPQLQTAEAARLATAMTNTVPTVTNLQWTVHQRTGGRASVLRLQFPLGRYERVYIQGGRVFLYRYGKWLLVRSRPDAGNGRNWQQTFAQWAFATLALRLSNGSGFSILPHRRIGGVLTEGIRYGAGGTFDRQVVATAWVNPESGLIVRLDRIVQSGGRTVERDYVDYTYQRAA